MEENDNQIGRFAGRIKIDDATAEPFDHSRFTDQNPTRKTPSMGSRNRMAQKTLQWTP